ncbi:hypothetical protein CEXT_456171 [Caerostris extrusa]|uniref:Uncharacterized protein n=1 Tax=Caerostris extrusa TaxID=172846 RepID=A0AAV4RVF3_CAEEX|nr:hypothetical protein CEXT_456171 [Caerostris extrusa]
MVGNEITSQIDEIGRSAFAARGDASPNQITNYPKTERVAWIPVIENDTRFWVSNLLRMLCSACLLGYGYDLLRKRLCVRRWVMVENFYWMMMMKNRCCV